MTARPDRRRRRTIAAVVAGVTLAGLAAGLTALGANAVINSTAGEAVQVDTRTVVSLPATDNAALAIVDEDSRLTSLVIVTLRPAGHGGSVVTIPVKADASIGFGDLRLPLDQVLDPTDPAGFFQQVEATLAITLQFGEIVGADRLAELIEPVVPFDAELPVDVIDSSAPGAGRVVGAGETRLNGPLAVRSLQAIDVEATERQQHSIDVAVWTGAASNAQQEGESTTVPLDDLGRPVESSTIDELFARLWSGPVQARDVALESPQPPGAADAVLLDRRDVVLVFSQISPARVSTPNPGPVFRIEIPISDAQLGESDAGLASRREVGLSLIGRLLFLEANVASVDATANPDGAPQVTRIEVANQAFVETMEELGPLVFGEVEVVVAEELIDGIDVVVRLGTGYLDAQETENVTDGGIAADDGAPENPDASTSDGGATVESDG